MAAVAAAVVLEWTAVLYGTGSGAHPLGAVAAPALAATAGSGAPSDAGLPATPPSMSASAPPSVPPSRLPAAPARSAAAARSAPPARSASPGCAGGCGGGPLRVAPYIDMGAYPTPLLSDVSNASSLKSLTLAFIIAGGNACKASWFNAIDPRTGWQLPEIMKIRQAGGDVKVSFGGEAGLELAQACTDVNALTAEYQAVVTAYKLKYIDFDVEGAAVADAVSVDRRSAAIRKLETANPGLKVSLTLPVLPSGLDGNGMAVLRSAQAHGVNIDVVNVMAMDYGGAFSGDSGALATQAAASTHNQLVSVFTGLSDTAAYQMVGITPMLGQNDDGRVFTLANARAVVAYASAHHVGALAFWEITRDRNACTGPLYQCTNVPQQSYDFSRIFVGYTG